MCIAMTTRASLGLGAITLLFFVCLFSIPSLHGKPSHDEKHLKKVPNGLAYTSTENSIKNFDKEKNNLTHQDFPYAEFEKFVNMTDDEREEIARNNFSESYSSKFSQNDTKSCIYLCENLPELPVSQPSTSHPTSSEFNDSEHDETVNKTSICESFCKYLSLPTYQPPISDIKEDKLTLEETRVVASLMEVFRTPHVVATRFKEQFQRKPPSSSTMYRIYDEFVRSGSVAEDYKGKSERDLRKDIFLDYDKAARPVKRPMDHVNVTIDLRPLTLIAVSDRQIVLDTYLYVRWSDEYLRWDSSEYGGIEELHIPATEIWTPDVSHYTGFSIHDTSVFPASRSSAIVCNLGAVVWHVPFTIRSKCTLPAEYTSDSFIYCCIQMGSWTYKSKLLDVHPESDEVDLRCFDHTYNLDWEIVKIVSSRRSVLGVGEHFRDEYPYIHFNVTLKSRNHDQKNMTGNDN